MQLVVIVLNKTEKLDDLLSAFEENGITGATILDSKGMASELTEHEDYPIVASLRLMLNPAHRENKTIFMLTQDEKVMEISRIANSVNGGFDQPDTGILFTVPVGYAEGLHKVYPEPSAKKDKKEGRRRK